MRKVGTVIWAAAMLLLPQSASAIPANEFVSRIQALSGRPLKPNNPQLAMLLDHVRRAADDYAKSLVASRNAGTPRSCPPQEQKLTLDDLVTSIRNAPPSIQQGEFTLAFAYIMDRRFPCGEAVPTIKSPVTT